MEKGKLKDYIFGIIVLAIGIFYTIMSLQITNKGGVVNARTVPLILGGLMLILGVMQLILTVRKKDEREAADKIETIDTKTVIKTAILILIYIALFDFVGFIIMTILFLVSQFVVLSPAKEKVPYPIYIGIAVVVTLFIYFVFRYGLDIMLPQGFITFI